MRTARAHLHLAILGIAAVAAAFVTGCSDDGGEAGSDPEVNSAEPPSDRPPPEVVLDLSGDTSTEPPIAGLLAVALTRDGGKLLTLQNTRDGALTLKAFPYRPGGSLTPADGRIVMRLDHPYVHSGGGLVVEENGDVLVGVAAFRHPGEPLGTQNPDGTVIRVPASFVVDDSPTFTPTSSAVVARGLRQPWRLSLDRDSGDLWIGDVGEQLEEEIDVIAASGLRGPPANFGWPYREGTTSFIEPTPAGLELVEPRWSRDRVGEPANLIGGYVYRGDLIPGLLGDYVFTDYFDGELMALPADGSSDEAVRVGQVDGNPTGFAEDPSGELLLLTADGTVHRLDAAAGSTDSPDAIVDVQPVATIWRSPPTDNTSEATSLIAAGGSSLLASERGGRVIRVGLDDDRGGVCALQFTQLPQLARESPEQIESGVEQTLDSLARHGADLPERLQPQLASMTAAYSALRGAGTSSGWASPEFTRLILEMSIERGEFADAQRAESSIANYVNATCS